MAEKYTEAQKRATLKYRETNIKRYTVEFSKTKDSDLIEYLDSVDNRTGTIKQAIREKMEREDNGRHTD